MDLSRAALLIELTQLEEALDSSEVWVRQIDHYQRACRYRDFASSIMRSGRQLTEYGAGNVRNRIDHAWGELAYISPEFSNFRG